ncbi:phosphatase PAP2 family protein [Paenibacillus sp. MBLB4367]|uniref:phosphatase PAP2 family protein n=1 Tax=Paenibacillus sp. MBLB4367 TaxID=3384767 RepID=UPI0039080170
MQTKLQLKAKRFAPLLWMLVFPVLGWMYAFVNKPGEKVYNLVTDLDRAIPFLKIFALPYSIWIFYIYVCLVYFFLKDPAVYAKSLKTYVLCALTCYMIYLVFQTTVPRPMLEGTDPVTRLMAYIYDRDQPFNCFPSIHCFSSYMVMKALYTSNFRNKWNQTLIYGMSTLIILSTLFVKQHVILDVVAAIALVEVVYRLLSRASRVANPAGAGVSRHHSG